jgi:excisionase family DNA binding protein
LSSHNAKHTSQLSELLAQLAAAVAEPDPPTPTPMAVTSTERVLLSVEEAAERLSISRTRVYALIKTGALVSVRVGRLRRVPAEALTEFTARLVAEQHIGRNHAA